MAYTKQGCQFHLLDISGLYISYHSIDSAIRLQSFTGSFCHKSHLSVRVANVIEPSTVLSVRHNVT